jgi:hypothetical protein
MDKGVLDVRRAVANGEDAPESVNNPLPTRVTAFIFALFVCIDWRLTCDVADLRIPGFSKADAAASLR